MILNEISVLMAVGSIAFVLTWVFNKLIVVEVGSQPIDMNEKIIKDIINQVNVTLENAQYKMNEHLNKALDNRFDNERKYILGQLNGSYKDDLKLVHISIEKQINDALKSSEQTTHDLLVVLCDRIESIEKQSIPKPKRKVGRPRKVINE